MSVNTMHRFMEYFDEFEQALQTGAWSAVANALSDDVRYSVEGVPFGCEIQGRDAVVQAFQRSTSAFDATMDFRMLEIVSLARLGQDHIRVDLLSGYGRDDTGTVTAPVTIEVKADEHGIVELRDVYDPVLTAPALAWIAENFADADPSYV